MNAFAYTQAHSMSIFSTITSRNNGTGAAIHLSILGDMYMYTYMQCKKHPLHHNIRHVECHFNGSAIKKQQQKHVHVHVQLYD